MSTDLPKGYIITTGDISDFDGFLALPLYYQKAAQDGLDVVFVMNYPAYFRKEYNVDDHVVEPSADDMSKNAFKRAELGLGYTYGHAAFQAQNPDIADYRKHALVSTRIVTHDDDVLIRTIQTQQNQQTHANRCN